MAFGLTPWEPSRGMTIQREEVDEDPSLQSTKADTAGQEEVLDRDMNIAAMYLKEMSKLPLLTREREVALAKRIQVGERKIHKLLLECLATLEESDSLGSQLDNGEIKPRGFDRFREELSKEVVRKLEELSKHSGNGGGRARDLLAELKKTEADLKAAKAEMVQSNLRLVVRIAKEYANRGLSFLDLLQEGNLGLMRAVGRYDYRKGFKFSTYAVWWIRQYITRALADKSRTIRVPNHVLEMKGRISRISHQFFRERGREPHLEEIASESGIDLSNVQKVMDLIQEPVSLETPLGEDRKLEDLIESEESLGFIEDLLQAMDQARKTRELLSFLNPREQQILRLRFGIGEPKSYTLGEVGKRYGLSRERIRQIEQRALRKLKGRSRAREMYGGLRGIAGSP
ncbi:MAG: sigma-70 family RNA polymerase sigma factor [Proteobacteria bacterium]|nr:sigma-70 family RNA polymerase sigma factor [Pseudomonadota bacterium]